MKRELLILLCSILLGAGTAGCMAGLAMGDEARTMAWWELLYERPNPDRLPVQVHFLWADKR